MASKLWQKQHKNTEAIRKKMKRKGFTQKSLADEAKVSPRYLQAFLQPHTQFLMASTPKLARLCQALESKPIEFFSPEVAEEVEALMK